MNSVFYTIRIITSKAKSVWDTLDVELRQEIENELRARPKHDPNRPKSRRHLKGKILGKNRRCHWEYRELPDAWRVFYTVNERTRLVEIEYIGPHP